jgi:hypothetical protein
MGVDGYNTSYHRYPGVIINIDIYNITIAFIKQTVSAFPLSYLIAKNFSSPLPNIDDVIRSFDIIAIIIASIFFFLSVFVLKYVQREISEEKITRLDLRHLSIIGLLVLILPGILVSLSSKYQKELYWGVGYLPVYISYFGVAIIIICAIILILNNKIIYNKILIKIIIISMVISLTGALTYTSNENVIENLNQEWLYPRLIIEDALNDGLFKFVPDDSILLVDSSNPLWEQPSFYLMHSGVRLRSVESNGAMSKRYLSDFLPHATFISNNSGINFIHFPKSNNIFYLRYGSQSRCGGYALLGKIIDLVASNKSLNLVTAKDVYIYVFQQNGFNPTNEICVEGYRLVNKSTQSYGPFILTENELKLVSSGKEWKIFSMPEYDSVVDVSTLNIYSVYSYSSSGRFGSPEKYDLKIIDGFWGIEDWSGTPTRWMNADSILSVTSRENCTANLSLRVISFYRNRTLAITANGAPAAQVAVPISFINLNLPIVLAKGANIISLHALGGCERPIDKPELNNFDPRCLSMAVQNLIVS